MPEPRSRRPNFLVIVADDLGYSDIGPYGSEIHTPNLANLSKSGVRMTNFHTAAACSPTRSMLFSGTDNHLAGLGEMYEYMLPYKDYFKDKPGYEGYLNWRVAALSEILEDNGYFNIMSGKWHLGLTKELAPCSRGFHKSFAFLPGAGNHYGYEPQFEDDVYFPALSSEGLWMEGETPLDHKEALPKDFYSTNYFTEKFIQYLKDRTEQEKEQPFFGYLAFTAPHWPLQAPREVVQKYAGQYDDGPDKLAQARYRRLVNLGLVAEGTESAPPIGKDKDKYEWTKMDETERARSARAMEVFAAMVELIDDAVGRVVDYLKSIDQLDDTFILFMSDNGAEGATLEAIPVMGGSKTMNDIFEKYYDQSLENIGQPDSFIWYGPRWASAAMAPSRGVKSWVTEGGIRCPCLIHYPPFHTEPSAISPAFTTVMDILPTMLELAGVKHPGEHFRNRTVCKPRGKSWVDYLSSSDYRGGTVHGEDEHIHGWEFLSQRAIREGKWKAVFLPPPRGQSKWELFNLAEDPAELHDRSTEHPDLLNKLVAHWEQFYSETGMVPTPMFGRQ